ncbi:hypothetical protein GW766_02560 [Candidatus Parcubacteria bacterium]|nr:hypothetical protein [Candidatus Parcubacteria bacterium]
MHFLIAVHAVLGEVGALAFLWAMVEILNPDEARLRRARIAAFIGVVCLSLAWVAGGTHYLTEYADVVKPVIKSGPMPWAHAVIMEMKEHVFLFLPFLGMLGLALVNLDLNAFRENKRATIILCALIVLLAFAMAGMGFIISSGFRAALETNII